MSPAKRKTSRPGRSATVAARGGKARGKARGSALTKAVKVKGKTPAGRGDHRLKAQTGARNGVRNGAGVACDLPREQLELLLDRDGGRADVLAHVPACHPCTTSLTVIASQRDAIRHLTAEPSGTAVEYLLERGARAGERKLADLVYELAKACLVAVQDLEHRVEILDRPRHAGAIRRDVNGIVGRSTASQRTVEGLLPIESAITSDAFRSCRSCLEILNSLEGSSLRQALTSSVLLIHSDESAAAAASMRSLLRGKAAPEYRRLAYSNLMWALVRQRDFGEVMRVGHDALSEFPGDWNTTFNLAVAAAWLRKSREFQELAGMLARMQSASKADRVQRTAILNFEAPRFAEALGIDVNKVRRSLGLTDPTMVGTRHANN